jgi:DNA-binding XRE family transcriptional regulator
MDKKTNNLRVQREKTQKELAKEIEQSKKLMGDDKPVDE